MAESVVSFTPVLENANATGNGNANATATGNENKNGSATSTKRSPVEQKGGRRRARKTRRRNISNMSWLRRRVNSLTLKNLQREETRLSEEEDHEMPGRRAARKTRRHRRA